MKPTLAAPVDPDELKHRLRQQKLVSDFGTFCLRTHDIQVMLQEATRACAEGLRCEMCKVLEHRPAHNDFLVVAGVGWKPGVVGHATLGPDRESPAGFAVESRSPVISNELATDGRFRTPALLIEHGVKSAINVMIAGDETYCGVLEVDSRSLGKFSDADSSFLQGFANLLGVAIERQTLESELRLRQKSLERALEHERMLVSEVHHRAKNSLALVAGLLSLHQRKSQSQEVRDALNAAESRVQSLAQVHDHLARRSEVSGLVSLKKFVDDLCERLSAANPRHHLVCGAIEIDVTSDRAITLALLVNELVTNAVKYAYPNGSGEVRVSIQPSGEARLVLAVSDDGVGMPARDAGFEKGLGTTVINALSKQLGGILTWQQLSPGTRVVLDFPGNPSESREP